MQKPDIAFHITVSPVFTVRGCRVKREQEERGLYGCHYYTECPDCQIISRGYECWGENMHLQGSPRDYEHLKYWLKLKVREQWRGKGYDGLVQLHGYTFAVGGPIYYYGQWLT